MAVSQEIMSEIVLDENEFGIFCLHFIKKKQGDNIDYFVSIFEHEKDPYIVFHSENMILLHKKDFDILLHLLKFNEYPENFMVEFENDGSYVTFFTDGRKDKQFYSIHSVMKGKNQSDLFLPGRVFKNLSHLKSEIDAGFEENSAIRKNKPINYTYIYDI